LITCALPDVNARRIASGSGAQVHPVHVADAPVDEIRDDAALTAMQRGILEGLVADTRKQWDAFIDGTPGASDLHLDVCVAHRRRPHRLLAHVSAGTGSGVADCAR